MNAAMIVVAVVSLAALVGLAVMVFREEYAAEREAERYRRRHHARFLRRVTARTPRLVCQECRGYGEDIAPGDSGGQGPWTICAWCEGTRYVTPWGRGQWLTSRRKQQAPQ